MNEYYYLNENREPQGPHTLDELRALLATGKLQPDTKAARKGDSTWRDLQAVLDTPAQVMSAPPQSAPAGTCPACATELSAANNQLPECCPACGYRLRAFNIHDLWQNFVLALRKSFTIKGRAPRIEYWSFVLFSTIIVQVFLTVLQIVAVSMLPEDTLTALDNPGANNMPDELPTGALIMLFVLGLVYFLLNLAVMVPHITVTIRRLHDVGRSGMWLLGYFVLLGVWILSLLSMVAALPFLSQTEATPYDSVLPIMFVVMLLITLAACLYIFILTVLDSQRGPNKYGPSPKYPIS
ncbi:MAG: DUF805 domain-containing protein [Akkermansia sp.]|nr:DUF805 domain-containing protein [Akkermansia sp.]